MSLHLKFVYTRKYDKDKTKNSHITHTIQLSFAADFKVKLTTESKPFRTMCFVFLCKIHKKDG